MTMPYICCQFQKRVSRNERSVLDDHGNRVVRLDEDYADSQRFAMNIGNETFFLFGDQLGSTSGVMNASGQIVEKGYYLPWGRTKGEETITSTDYRYTGWMKEGGIYFYNAR